MTANKDALGDMDFSVLDNAIAAITSKGGNGAAVITSRYYGYYESIGKFACAICVSTIDGDEEMAKKHTEECLKAPKIAADKNRVFCPVCWRGISHDNSEAHFLSVGHKQTVDRMQANTDGIVSVWLMKNGPTFVQPKETNCQTLSYGFYDKAERLNLAIKAFAGYTNEKKIREQIVNALRASSGNFGTATAKLSTNSPLVAALRNIILYASIGALPCERHSMGDEYQPQLVLSALRGIFPPSVVQALEFAGTSPCRLCENPIPMFKNPKNVAKAVAHVAGTITGEYKPEKKKDTASMETEVAPVAKRPAQ
jgi:hypothetical protein